MKIRWALGCMSFVAWGCAGVIGEDLADDVEPAREDSGAFPVGPGSSAGGSGSGIAGSNGGPGIGPSAGGSGAGSGPAVNPGGGGSGGSTGAGGSTGPSTRDAGVSTDAGAFVAGPYCKIPPILRAQCVACHTSPPVAGAPMSLLTYADLMAPAKSNAARSVAQLVLERMQNTTRPMPPAPLARSSTGDVQAVQDWIASGSHEDPCTPPAGSPGARDAGSTADGSSGPGIPVLDAGNPYGTPLVCTSMNTWRSGTGSTMRPGEACIACHSRGEGPTFVLAGTVYPTAHEPNDCLGVNGPTARATVVITDANNRIITMNVNASGNFSYNGALATPFRAKVIRNGVERMMATPQTIGDCNRCHTVNGATGAPGRIMLP